jgi:type II secretory pathway pseudopilin PulG
MSLYKQPVVRMHLKAFTVAELLIAMMIVSVIGVVSMRAFLQVLPANRDLRQRAVAYENARLATDALRRTIANLVPAAIGGIAPYSESIDSDSGMSIYSFLTRVPEKSFGDNVSGDIQAVQVEYKLSRQDMSNSMTLSYSKRYVNYDGKQGDVIQGTLATNLCKFNIMPIREMNSNGEEILVAFNVAQDYSLPDQDINSISLRLPTRAWGPEKNK